jgi:hypothetical protein
MPGYNAFVVFGSSGCGACLADFVVRYHYLNHYALFGGGYRDGALDVMKKLYRKYGQK